MHNIWLIAKREYMERVRTRGFILATVLIPCLMAALIGGSAYFMSRTKTNSHIAVVTSDQTLGQDIKHQLETGKNSEMTVDVMEPSAATQAGLDAQLHMHSSQLAGYLWITPGQPGERPHFAYHARSAGDIATEDAIESGVHTVLTREGLLSHGLTGAQIDEITAPVDIDTSASGNTTLAFFVAYGFFFLMYMVIMLYGMNTARSIIEEKSSRVFEVLLATIKPDQLLAGKIIGVGAVGTTQVGVWMVAAAFLASSSMVTHLAGGGNSVHGLLSASQIGFFVLYFIFGFLLYSSMAAALGAMTNSEQELQQLNMFLVLPLAFCMVMLAPTVRAPDSTLAQVISLIPFCSPLLMNFRTALTSVPAWQIILSVVFMSITIGVVIWISSRIYRVGILMYGKRPNLPEIMRWLRYS
jgi:ABC-2 type transport system permease protein